MFLRITQDKEVNMKVQINDDGKKAIMQIIGQVLKARQDELNSYKFVDVLEEIGSTGAWVFIRTALDLFADAEIIGKSKDISELIKEM